MSGTTPSSSKPQKCSPMRPKPTCTSSATHTPPAARTASNAVGQVPGRIDDLTPATLQRLGEERRRRVDLRVQRLQRIRRGRQCRDVGPARPSGPAGAVELVRAERDLRAQMPVIGVVEHDHVLAAGVCRGEPQREVVGLRARVHEEAHVQRVRERRRQRPRVVDHRSVQVARVRVQLRHLPRAGLDHARVAVADVGDVVDQVEVRAAVGVVEVRAAPADDVQRLAIGQRERLAHHDRAARRDVRSRGSRGDAARQPEQQVRVRADAAPQVGLVAQRHAGQVGRRGP